MTKVDEVRRELADKIRGGVHESELMGDRERIYWLTADWSLGAWLFAPVAELASVRWIAQRLGAWGDVRAAFDWAAKEMQEAAIDDAFCAFRRWAERHEGHCAADAIRGTLEDTRLLPRLMFDKLIGHLAGPTSFDDEGLRELAPVVAAVMAAEMPVSREWARVVSAWFSGQL